MLVGGACVPLARYFDSGVHVAQVCDSGCYECVNVATNCTSCNGGFYLVGNLCVECGSKYDGNCSLCTGIACTACNSPLFLAASGSCITCATFGAQCSLCNTTECQNCSTGYFLTAAKSCSSCTSFDPLCSSCTLTSCTQCSPSYILSAGSCLTCAQKHNPQCTTCNDTHCLTCQQGYQLNTTTFQCFTIVCGDGAWVESSEACDDGNLENGDGCDAYCKVEADYVCLPVDRLPSGASFCKYNKNITMSFNHLLKE